MREVEVDQQDTDQVYFQNLQKLEQCIKPVSYTHLTLPTM